ncbi:MAG TPA: hypothetical protein VLW85_12515, partial [Myxococcales bacterium]|nr:hypothetical protein [Myxococcales bacterium]
MKTALALLLLLIAACSSSSINDKVLASPDQRHALFFSPLETARSVDVITGLTVAQAEGLVPGVFSRNGQVLLSWTDQGHLVTLRVDGGAPVDLGPSIDRGRISDDGAHVAWLAKVADC